MFAYYSNQRGKNNHSFFFSFLMPCASVKKYLENVPVFLNGKHSFKYESLLHECNCCMLLTNFSAAGSNLTGCLAKKLAFCLCEHSP